MNTLLLHRATRTKLPLQYSACSSYQPDLLLMSGQSASQVSLINGFKKQIFNRWERRQAWRWSPWALQLYCDVLIFECSVLSVFYLLFFNRPILSDVHASCWLIHSKYDPVNANHLRHPGHPDHPDEPGHPGYPVSVSQWVLQGRVYHGFGIFVGGTHFFGKG